jgi:hypothetical protein
MASVDVRGPETLAFGPGPIRRPSWRPVAIVLVAALLVTAALAVCLRSRPTDYFAFADLQDIYSGMVRSDGTNDAAVLSRDRPRPAPVAVLPRSCLPLVETTLADQLPANALDGVSTYWLGEGSTTSAVSLFTLRYRDGATALREYQAIDDALSTCDGNEVTVGPNAGLVTATPVSNENGARAQLGYLVTLATGDRYAISVLQYANTITWQFRLEFGNQPYESYVAQRVMDSFMAQVLSIQELRR